MASRCLGVLVAALVLVSALDASAGIVPHGWQSSGSTQFSGTFANPPSGSRFDPVGPNPPAGVWGFVWVDANHDGLRNGSDTPIMGATIDLYNTNDLAHPIASTLTNVGGLYQFSNLQPGTYAIGQRTLRTAGEVNYVGTILDGNNLPVTTNLGSIVSGKDLIVNILLDSGFQGREYNFTEATFPPGMISKRMMLASSEIINPVPEPGTLVLLFGAALSGLAVALRRRFSNATPRQS